MFQPNPNIKNINQDFQKDFQRDKAIKQHEAKKKRFNERFEKDKIHYQKLLNDILNYTFSQITPETSAIDMQKRFEVGNKCWIELCARVRKTNKVLSLNINGFKLALIERLKTIPEKELNGTKIIIE